MREDKSKQITIYVDESGTLPDINDKVIILAAVSSDTNAVLQNILNKIKKRIKVKQSKNLPEIKFYHAGEKTRLLFMEELNKSSIEIFVLIIDKKGQKIPDTPFNYAILAYFLIEECLVFHRDNLGQITFDRHFHKQTDLDEFNKLLRQFLGRNFLINHVDSKASPSVNIADMVAGSALANFAKNDNKYYQIISDKILSEKRLNWKEAKRLFISKTKKLH